MPDLLVERREHVALLTVGEALRWADGIAANASLAVKAIERLYRHGLTQEDFQEGVMAFTERRAPRFAGR